MIESCSVEASPVSEVMVRNRKASSAASAASRRCLAGRADRRGAGGLLTAIDAHTRDGLRAIAGDQEQRPRLPDGDVPEAQLRAAPTRSEQSLLRRIEKLEGEATARAPTDARVEETDLEEMPTSRRARRPAGARAIERLDRQEIQELEASSRLLDAIELDSKAAVLQRAPP